MKSVKWRRITIQKSRASPNQPRCRAVARWIVRRRSEIVVLAVVRSRLEHRRWSRSTESPFAARRTQPSVVWHAARRAVRPSWFCCVRKYCPMHQNRESEESGNWGKMGFWWKGGYGWERNKWLDKIWIRYVDCWFWSGVKRAVRFGNCQKSLSNYI